MATKSEKCKKVYVGSDGEAKSWNENANAIEFRFANGQTHSVKPSDFPDEMQTALAFFGISEKLGNAYASSESPDDAEQKFLSLHEQIMSGEWIAEREGSAGPMPSLVGEAIVRVLVAAGKLDGNDAAAVNAKKAQYMGKDTKGKRDNALLNPAVKTAFEEIKLERQQARVAEAKAASAGANAPTVETL